MIPIIPVIKPPVLNEIWRGERLLKSLAGLTTLAAMLTDMVAIITPSNAKIAIITRVTWDYINGSVNPGGGISDVNYDNMYTGSQSLDISTPGIITLEALVTITPMAENATIVVGSPNVYPSICSLWLFPNLVKSGTLRLRVAQNPIMAVNEGINTTQNS